MQLSALNAISPIDGRYWSKTNLLSNYFSEGALIKYRLKVEIEYFISLCELPLPQLRDFDPIIFEQIRNIYKKFSDRDAKEIKKIEIKTNHDVKAVEYFIKKEFRRLKLDSYLEFIHFGLTSQDVNNTAIPLCLKNALEEIYLPSLVDLLKQLRVMVKKYKSIPLLAHTHGQPASPTRLGKEIDVFVKRIEIQKKMILKIPFSAKFSGAIGNFNAHHIAYPKINWKEFGKQFVEKRLGLDYSFPTTQIEHYDSFAALCDNMKRINTILIDLNRDLWQYISMDYFKQKINNTEIGSSAMPHKVNPIDFENSEGNLGIANSIFDFFASKLPISRLQRDLSDSTVLRNVGVPIGHTLIGLKSTLKGLRKLVVNNEKIKHDLNLNWTIISEAIQTVLRREGYPKPYEALKEFTRTNSIINQKTIHKFINQLNVKDEVKSELKKITPFNYTGI